MVAPPTVVSLFSGAGGLDVGLERAGWATSIATDFDADCMSTLTASLDARIPVRGRADVVHLEGTTLLHADVAELAADDLRPDGETSAWRPDLVVGGPPCQPWSSAGLQQGFSDPRGRMVSHFVRLVGELRPRFALFENVRGLVTAVGKTGRPGEALEDLQYQLSEVGFASTLKLLNAADYGAAQRRVRLFLIASADHALPEFPTPTHEEPDPGALLTVRAPWISLGAMLETLPQPAPEDVVRPSGERAAQLQALAPGSGLRTGGRVEANRPGGHWGYRQDSFLADLSRPSRTIRAASTPDWIRVPDGGMRRLTWRECAALQGFPTGWAFAGTRASRFRQVGNAVQADMAEAIGRRLAEALARGPSAQAPQSPPWPDSLHKRVRYTVAEHRVNGEHRVRVRVAH